MKKKIEDRFDNWIKWKFKKKDIQDFIINHERKHICLENLIDQVKTAALRNPSSFNTKKLAYLIDWAAGTFASAAVEHRHQQMMSDIDKQKLMQNKEAEYEAEQAQLREEFGIDDKANDKSL